MTQKTPARQIIGFCIVIFAMQFMLASCDGKNVPAPEERQTAGIFYPTEPAPSATVVPTLDPTAQATATALPTVIPTATEVLQVELFVPEFLERNTLAAIHELEAAGTSWGWKLTNSRDRAVIHLEPGDHGIPAGYRTIAITVPFDANLEDISFGEADRMLIEGQEGIISMDWAVMPAHRRALRVDGLLPSDNDYPMKEGWSLVAAKGYETAANELAAFLRESLDEDFLVQITAVGDLMLDRAIGYALRNGDLSFPFAAVASVLNQADITIGNLESALGDRGQPEVKSYTFQAPPEAAEALAMAGFDLVSLANNHAMDYGPEALQQALQLLDHEGIATVGAGPNESSARAPFIIEHDELTVAFLGYVDVPVEASGFDTHSWSATEQEPGVAWAEPAQIEEDVKAALPDSDLIVVLLHSGYEYVEAPSPDQTLAARAAIDAGADLVIGHHSHVLQGIEFDDDSSIVYGLGNFAFEIDGDPTTTILNVWLDSSGVRQIELIPAIIEAGGRPRLAVSWEAYDIRQRVFYLSRLLNDLP